MGKVQLDGSNDEYETYFIVDDDDLSKMVGMEYCVQDSELSQAPEHFRGFRPKIYSPVSGYQNQKFGDMSASNALDHCH